MTTHKRKKATKYRASQTHGGGAKKKRRGSGNRGGKGRAGTGKRADVNKPCVWSDEYYMGRHGFKMQGVKELITATNIGDVNDNTESLKRNGFAEEKSGVYVVDLEKAGFNKLLGSGIASKKLMIKVKYASENAIEKVKKAGGDLILTGTKKEGKKIKTEAQNKVPEKTSVKKQEPKGE